jgi:acyl-CoA thioester hydrolase
MGHMTTRHYVAMFDDASYHCLYRLFGWTGKEAQSSNLGFADVKHTIEYLDEVHEGDLIEIRGELIKLGGKSVTIQYEMRRATNQTLVATLESISVLFDTKERRAVAIPDEYRAKAESAQA